LFFLFSRVAPWLSFLCLRAATASVAWSRRRGFDRVLCVVQKCARDPAGRFRGRVGPRGLGNRVAAVGAALGLARRVGFAPIAPFRCRLNFFSQKTQSGSVRSDRA